MWFTADTHFGHANIIRFSNRPFFSVQEMDEELIKRWNAVVGPYDPVWHLGDFNYRSALPTSHYLSRLNGRINIVWGNHDDKYAKKSKDLFVSSQDAKYLLVKFPGTVSASSVNGVGLPSAPSHAERRGVKQRPDVTKIVLYHYAQRVWRSSNHGSWHLYGHSHGGLPSLGRSMDVGVDCNNYTPIHIDEIRERIGDSPLTYHHPVARLVSTGAANASDYDHASEDS